MAAIFLHGYLGEKYGRKFDFSVNSVAEAVRLLNANFGGFLADVILHRPGFLVRVNGVSASGLDALNDRVICPEIHIVPAISGAGEDDNGVGKILAASLLVYAGMNGYLGDYTSLGYSLAANMAISGVSQMLFSTKQSATDDITGETNKASYAFSGAVNTTAQGNPVPVLYGRLLIGSQVISAGITSNDA